MLTRIVRVVRSRCVREQRSRTVREHVRSSFVRGRYKACRGSSPLAAASPALEREHGRPGRYAAARPPTTGILQQSCNLKHRVGNPVGNSERHFAALEDGGRENSILLSVRTRTGNELCPKRTIPRPESPLQNASGYLLCVRKGRDIAHFDLRAVVLAGNDQSISVGR